MKQSLKTGLSFGITSGVITTLGLIIGLNAGTGSKMVVLGGILTIAVADSFSDALAIHISEESKEGTPHKAVWEATIASFLAKLVIAGSFTLPVIFLDLQTAVLACLIWGGALLSFFSYYAAKQTTESPWKTTFEHLLIATTVIISTNYLGGLISKMFDN